MMGMCKNKTMCCVSTGRAVVVFIGRKSLVELKRETDHWEPLGAEDSESLIKRSVLWGSFLT